MTVVHAPLPGRVVALDEVPDPVFAGQIVGSGVAIEPADGAGELLVVSPVAGRVAKVHPHALAVADETGTGVLVHLGIDTVQLKGEGFGLLASEGAEVRAGDPLISWDPAAVELGGRSPVCPVIALDAAADALAELAPEGDVKAGEPLFTWRR